MHNVFLQKGAQVSCWVEITQPEERKPATKYKVSSPETNISNGNQLHLILTKRPRHNHTLNDLFLFGSAEITR